MCDYESGGYTVTFPAGITRVSFDVNITDDDVFEGLETFSLTITSSSLPSHVTRGDPYTATVIIVDDEERK